jgi:exosortase
MHRWWNEADYSHGFFVPLFAAFLLWHRRGMVSSTSTGGRWLGMILVAVTAGIRFAAAYLSSPLVDAVSIPVCMAGIALLLGGWEALRWSWPAVVFLFFMIPLPGIVSERLAGPLQRVATECGTFALQTLGVPAGAAGNVIYLSQDPPIMVVEACSGLRMLVCFLAITMGAAFVLEWALLERVVVLLSGFGIAVAANVIRITSTGFVHEHFGPEVAQRIFHDFAGWLMMPLACLMVGLELWLINKAFPKTIGGPVIAGHGQMADEVQNAEPQFARRPKRSRVG